MDISFHLLVDLKETQNLYTYNVCILVGCIDISVTLVIVLFDCQIINLIGI